MKTHANILLVALAAIALASILPGTAPAEYLSHNGVQLPTRHRRHHVKISHRHIISHRRHVRKSVGRKNVQRRRQGKHYIKFSHQHIITHSQRVPKAVGSKNIKPRGQKNRYIKFSHQHIIVHSRHVPKVVGHNRLTPQYTPDVKGSPPQRRQASKVFGISPVKHATSSCLRLEQTAFDMFAGESLRYKMAVHPQAWVRLASQAMPENIAGGANRNKLAVTVPMGHRYLAKGHQSTLPLDVQVDGSVASGVYTLRLPYQVFGAEKRSCGASRALALRIHVSQPRHMTASELNRVGQKLAKQKPETYHYVEIRGTKDGGHFRASYMIRRLIHGLFVMRDPKDLKPLGSGMYDDGQGNRIMFGQLNKKKKKGKGRISVEHTIFADGSTMFAEDLNGNGVIDRAFGDVTDGRFNKLWWIDNVIGSHLWSGPCGPSFAGESAAPGSSKGDDTSSGSSSGASGSQSTPCTPSFGGGGGGGSAGAAWPAGNSPLLGTPDCSPSPGNLSEVSDEGISAEQWALIEEGYAADEMAAAVEKFVHDVDVRPRVSQAQIDQDKQDAWNAVHAYDRAAQHAYDELVIENLQYEKDHPNGSSGSGSQQSSSNNKGNGSSGSGSQQSSSHNQGNATGGQPSLVGGPGGGGSDVKDPRCPHDTSDAFQMARLYCAGRDLLQCLEKAQDPVRNITGGTCWSAPGLAGGTMIVCAPNQSASAGVHTGSPGGPTAGSNDLPVSAGLKNHGHIDKAFISTMPLGGVIAAMGQMDRGVHWGQGAGNP